MKKIILCSSLIMLMIAISGCDHRSSEPRTTYMRHTADTLTTVLTPVDSARVLVEYYDHLCKSLLPDSVDSGKVPIKAFTIRAEDLLGALGIPSSYADSAMCLYKHVRVYLGYKRNVGFKLFFVPVDSASLSGAKGNWKAGVDVPLDSNGRGMHPPYGAATDAGEYVLDLNAPCPSTCPSSSVMSSPASKKK